MEKINAVAKYYLECKNFSGLLQNDTVGLASGFFQQTIEISMSLETVSLGQKMVWS